MNSNYRLQLRKSAFKYTFTEVSMFMKIPSLILRQLYTYGSLKNTNGGVRYSLKNRLSDAKLVGVSDLKIDKKPVPINEVHLTIKGKDVKPTAINASNAIDFPLREVVDVFMHIQHLDEGKHEIEISFVTEGFGKFTLKIEDSISEDQADRVRIPYDKEDDYSPAIIKKRQEFISKYSGATFNHIDKYSIDPKTLPGNIENFTGVAQVPLGFAGPIHIKGEHAQGEFLVPLATTEGTLVASYNRGIKAINLSGGCITTVVDDCMQRAPVFIFENARQGREFFDWMESPEIKQKIKEEAEGTSSIAKLLYIDPFFSNKFVYLRFNYSTGDAAGQNMVGRATFAACSWILDNYPQKTIQRFYLESNFATDKKASQVNIMRTRGKRVTAECVLKKDVLEKVMRVDPHSLHYHWKVSTVGAFFSGANNNGAHSPNAITAMFIATGQDVANVSESSAGILYTELLPDGDLYISLTIPSLIVATYGGGTGLATQRECLEVMDCYGRDRAKKFAEIIAGVALAGEVSLGSAISSLDWVSSHEKYGRNR